MKQASDFKILEKGTWVCQKIRGKISHYILCCDVLLLGPTDFPEEITDWFGETVMIDEIWVEEDEVKNEI